MPEQKQIDGYREFQRIMAEANYKIKMEEERKKRNFLGLPPEFEQLFGSFKH